MFEITCDSLEINYRFELCFEEVSMRIKRVLPMGSIFRLRPLSQVVHVHNFHELYELSDLEMSIIFDF